MEATAAAVVALPPASPVMTTAEVNVGAEQAASNAVALAEVVAAAEGEAVGKAKLTSAAARTKEKENKALAEKAVQLFELFDGGWDSTIFPNKTNHI